MTLAKAVIARLPTPVQDRFRCWHYARKLRDARWTDEPELEAVKCLVEPGDVVLDIGANFGLFTRFLAETVGESGRVIAFEPSRDMFLVLESNRRFLGWENVECHACAISDRPGEGTLTIPRRPDGTLNHYESALERGEHMPPTGRDSTKVPLQSVDSFCRERGIEQVSFIKCDVEGHEIAVLQGAVETIRMSRPTILIEINESLDDHEHGRAVLTLVESLDYEILVFEEGEIRERGVGESRVNYVLRPRDQGLRPAAA